MRGAEHHPGPVRDECLRRSEPQTAAAAGDEVNPAVQPKIHPAILPVRGRVASSMRPTSSQHWVRYGLPARRGDQPFSLSTMAL